MADGFPWDIFSANTLPSMIADVHRARGLSSKTLNKDESLALLRRIEEHGLDTALKSTRKHEEVEEEEPKPKRGRSTRKTEAVEETISAPAKRGRSRRAKPGEEETTPSPSERYRRAPATRGPSTRASRSRAPHRTSARVQATASPSTSTRKQSASVSRRAQQDHQVQQVSQPQPQPKPKDKGKLIFDGVELRKFLPARAKAGALVNAHADDDEEMPPAGDDSTTSGTASAPLLLAPTSSGVLSSGGVNPNPQLSPPAQPPEWLKNCVQDLQNEWKSVKFEVVCRPNAPENATAWEWRIKCLDCPGKLYVTGPGQTLEHYKLHLKNRLHRQRVTERMNGA
uniref:Uncharacterized protein n=1 Tax=Mycena chlorophos TaxID=658473 RepID=A0ABQ0L1F7_MYCCL|nr:predicted protein [Mycena chlorophos]